MLSLLEHTERVSWRDFIRAIRAYWNHKHHRL